MRRESALAAGIAAVLVASVLAAIVAPGAVAERDPGDVRPSHLDLREVTIASGGVSDGTATLSVTAYLDHRGGEARNVTLLVRAVDLESGLVEATREADVAPISGDREANVSVDVTVAREGGYRIETVLYRDDRRIGALATAVRGVGTLQSGGRVEFHRFGAGLPPVQYSVSDAGEDRTTLDVSTYLTNRGSEPSGPLTVELIVRQADSNIVAARATVPVESIPAGETVTPGTSVTVPAGYNYFLDAVLRKDGVIVDTARSVANLDPQERIEADTTVRDVGLRVEEFERERAAEPTPARRAVTEAAAGQPGFGPFAALTAIAAVAVIAWRRA